MMSERISLGRASQRSGQAIVDGSLEMLIGAASSTASSSSPSRVPADELGAAAVGDEVEATGARAVVPRYAGLRGLTT